MPNCPDLLANLPVGILLLDAEGQVVSFNHAANHLLGLKKARVVGSAALPTGWSMLDEKGQELPLHQQPGATALRLGEPVHNQIIGIVRNTAPELVWCQCSAFPEFNDEGQLSGAVLSFIDITPQREATLFNQRQRHRAEALLALNARAHQLDENTLLQEALKIASTLTASAEACLHLIEGGQPRLAAHSEHCSHRLSRRKKGANCLWEAAAVAHKPVVQKATGKGGFRIGIPVLENEQVVMVLCLGEKKNPYDDNDIQLLQTLGQDLWLILQHRRMVHAWQDDRRRLQMVLRASHIGVWEFDVSSGRSLVNREYMQMLGEDSQPQEDTLFTLLGRIHADDREHYLLNLTDYLGGKSPEYRQEFRLYLSNGELRWILSSGEIVERDEHGQPIRMVGTHQDITERKIFEEKLRLAATVFDTNGEGIMITDANARILTVNRAFCLLTGYRPDEVRGHKPSILSSGRHSQQFFSELWDAIQRQGFWQGELWNRHREGHEFPVWLSISAVSGANGKISHFVGIFNDITERKQQQDKIEYLAFHDALTGLPNRLLLADRFTVARALAERNGDQLALLFLDLDRFKIINDTLGHQAGDQLLIEVSARILEQIRESDTVSRLGGDEFVILLSGLHSPGEAAEIAQAVLSILDSPFQIAKQEIRIGATIGMAVYPSDALDLGELLKKGDTALYRAKRDGRNMYRFYTEAMNADSLEQLLLETRLREALARKELEVQYQPFVRLSDGSLLGMEALVRWRHPVEGLIPPSRFMPVAEESGLILDIGAYVLDAACRQMRVWLDAGIPPFIISVNLSALQIARGNLVDIVLDALTRSGLPAQYLELELTESMLLADADHSRETLTNLRRHGVHIAIDDFGTGYSSLAYLRRLDVEKLKIDQVFIDGLQESRDDELVRAIINMAQALGLETIAEGVETPEQASKLASMGCNAIQGWYLGPAASASACAPWLLSHQQGRPLLTPPIPRLGPNPRAS